MFSQSDILVDDFRYSLCLSGRQYIDIVMWIFDADQYIVLLSSKIRSIFETFKQESSLDRMEKNCGAMARPILSEVRYCFLLKACTPNTISPKLIAYLDGMLATKRMQ